MKDATVEQPFSKCHCTQTLLRKKRLVVTKL